MQERQRAPKQLERYIFQPATANQVIPLGADAVANAKAILTASVARAQAEARAAHDSPSRRLDGLPLTAIAAGDSAAGGAFVETVPAADKAVWEAVLRLQSDHHVLAPLKGRARAYWTVAPDTGAATASFLDLIDARPSIAGCGQPASRGGLNLPVALLEPNTPMIEIPGVGPLDLNAIADPGTDPINKRITFGQASVYLGAELPGASSSEIAGLLRALECA